MFINGKEIANQIGEKLKTENQGKGKKILSVFMIGDDPVIKSFVKIKKNFAEKIGVDFRLFKYEEGISEENFIQVFLEKQEKSDGVIIQLPLPEKFNTENILSKIDPKKDVDLLSPKAWEEFKNKKEIDKNTILSPVAGAVFHILKFINSEIEKEWKNKKIVLVGYGKLVGEPVGILLKKFDLNFSILDSKTNLEEKNKMLKEADLIISGVGIPEFIKKDMVKNGVILIDAGTSTANKKLVGDIALECSEKASYFSKTPGGVGPLTVAVLYENLFKLKK